MEKHLRMMFKKETVGQRCLLEICMDDDFHRPFYMEVSPTVTFCIQFLVFGTNLPVAKIPCITLGSLVPMYLTIRVKDQSSRS